MRTELPKYWYIENKYQIVRDYLSELVNLSYIKTWKVYNYIGMDGCSNNNGIHGCHNDSFYNQAIEITFEEFERLVLNKSTEPNYEIY